MSPLNKREKKGIMIFIALSCVIIMIGFIMKLFEQRATGYVRSRHGSGPVNFSGTIVMILGLLLLGFILGMYLWTRNDKE